MTVLHRTRAVRAAAALAAVAALGASAAIAEAHGKHGGKHRGHRHVQVVDERAVGRTWSSGDTRPGGSFELTRQHGAPRGFGKGALRLVTETDTAKVQMLSDRKLAGRPLSSVVGRVRYSTFRAPESTANPIQLPSINIAIDPDGPNGPDTFATLVYEPYYSSQANGKTGPNVQDGVWQTWDASAGYWWATGTQVEGNEPFASKTLAELSALNPDATILYYGINQGSGNGGLIAAVDGLVIGKQVFDFEPKKRSHRGHHKGHRHGKHGHHGGPCGPRSKARH